MEGQTGADKNRGSNKRESDNILLIFLPHSSGSFFPAMVCFSLLMEVISQYPYEQHEGGRYYSGYDDIIHDGESYTGYSIWVSPRST